MRNYRVMGYFPMWRWVAGIFFFIGAFCGGVPSAVWANSSLPLPSVTLSGFMQFDAGLTGFNERDFGFRRFRTDIRGAVSEDAEYRITLDYSGDAVVLADGYVMVELTDTQWIQVGKFKAPVGLELLRSSTALLLPEYGPTTYLVPNRDKGIQYINRTAHAEINVGVFAGAPDFQAITRDIDLSRSVSGRVFFFPVRTSHARLGIGMGGTVENRHGTASNTGLPVYGYRGYGALFSYADGVIADGMGYRVVPHGYFYSGPFGVFTEYALSSLRISKGAANTQASHTAWQVAFQYVATGEDASYGAIVPAAPFGVNGGWGALQLGLRAGELHFDNGLFPVFAMAAQAVNMQQFGGSANWIWNQSIRWTIGVELLRWAMFNGGTSSRVLGVLRGQVIF